MQIDAKTFFRGCRRLDKRIDGKCDEIERVRLMAERVTASYSDEPRGGGGPTSRVANAVARYVDMERELQREADRLTEYRRYAQKVISQLRDDRHRDILNWRYFSGWGWSRIAAAFDVDEKWVYKLHGRALREAQGILDAAAIPDEVQNYYLMIAPPPPIM